MQSALNSPSYWDARYKSNEANWDTGSANPVFIQLLQKKELIVPCKLLVVGCGKGFDAIAAAKEGYDVTALDFSSEAIKSARTHAHENKVNINFIQEDFFTLDNTQYDAVFEYTTYCAIDPSRRKEFALKIASITKPGGVFVSIVFPVDNRQGGPPFKIGIVEFYSNFKKYFKLIFSSTAIDSIKPRKGKEILQVYRKL